MKSMPDLEGDVLNTRSVPSDGKLAVEIVGSLDMETTPRWREFLAAITPRLTADNVDTVVFDTGQLYLMSSSAISCFAHFLKQLKAARPGCKVVFRTSAAHGWQRRAFEPLRRLAEDVVSIEQR
jgi:anti-anti-sigma factor